ncbi:hypothetical protein E3U55_12005 [Filobacillus milosensis]|uniref:Uncharacterized protein n=1 Tax=Filobacillus milosensis TaxID=94137 RepID=A0A4Y8IIT8_9BACI|nr:hypothetical protein [Filobacillus milosensis]TFB18509.1 hypothetical protein E3U55_12005 [Filobacillus milosensis]
MYIIGSFKSNINLELSLNELEEMNIREEDIFVIEMKRPQSSKGLFDSNYFSDEKSLMASITAWGVVGGTLGIIYGSQLLIGPVASGLIGLFLGALIGFLFDSKKNKNDKENKKFGFDVLLIINYKTVEQEVKIKAILHKYFVISIGVHK